MSFNSIQEYRIMRLRHQKIHEEKNKSEDKSKVTALKILQEMKEATPPSPLKLDETKNKKRKLNRVD